MPELPRQNRAEMVRRGDIGWPPLWRVHARPLPRVFDVEPSLKFEAVIVRWTDGRGELLTPDEADALADAIATASTFVREQGPGTEQLP